MVDWTLRVDGIIETNVYDVQVVDSASTFGDYAIAKIDDIGGGRFDIYNRGTRVELSVTPDTDNLTIQSGNTVTTTSGNVDTYGDIRNAGTYTNAGTVQEIDASQQEFEGYVVERREIDENGADALEIEAYTFDQFLRRNKVSNDQTGNSIATALEDIIKTDTPVDFVSSNINVGDEQELTRSYRGVPVEQALQDLAFKSENEEFGVNDDLEFFFRPREITHIDRGIDNTQWFRYDIPELGKEVINEVEVFFNDGDNSVIVDDGADKLDLQNSLGLSDPGTQRDEISRPKITDISDAEDEGRQYLKFRNATLSGTITTFDLFNAEPGDTIDVTINSRGIDTEFRIAEVDYRWGRDETILTIVEKRGDNDDVLFRLTEDVDRLETADADRDAIKNRVTTTNTRGIINTTTTVTELLDQQASTINSGETFSVDSGETAESETWLNAGTYTNAGTVQEPGDEQATVTVDSDRVVNPGRNLARDVWRGESIEPITEIVVGDDNSGISRSNDNLRNQTNSFSVSKTLPDSKTVAYSADFTATIQEFGLKTNTGRLVYRGVFDSSTEIDDIEIELAVSNDSSVNRGVVTNDGQTVIRDILADNNPNLPDQYAYGSGTSDPQESDTSLDNELYRQDLNEILIQNALSQSDFEDILPNIPDDHPITVKNGELQNAQTTFIVEAEDQLNRAGTIVTDTANLSNDEGVELEIANDFVTQSFTPEYRIPANEYVADVYANLSSFDGTIEIRVNGTTVQTESFSGLSEDQKIIDSPTVGTGLAEGEEHEMTVICTQHNSGDFVLDTLQVVDLGNRFSDADKDYNIDRVGSFDSGTASFSGPEKFPEKFDVDLTTATTRRDVTQSNFNLDVNNTENAFQVSLSNDGSTFNSVNNSASGSVTFNSANQDVDTTIRFSRHDGAGIDTPSNGGFNQRINRFDLFANPDAIVSDGIGVDLTRAIVPPNTSSVLNSDLSEAGIFGNSTLLTRSRFADFTVDADVRISSSETTEFSGEE